MRKTPVTKAGLEQYDKYSPYDAVIEAWKNEGSNPLWHRYMKSKVRKLMPVLGRALDRMAKNG